VVHGCVVGHDVVIPPGARLFNVVRPEARGAPGSRGISRWPWSRAAGLPMSDLGPAWN
jgi:hypothetical protein